MGIKKILAATMTAGIVLSLVPSVSMADSSGWKQDKAGWKYYVAGSGFVSNSWKQINGKWYYFMSSDYMVQGVTDYMIGNIYYNFNSSGACTNPGAKYQKYQGWHKICNCYYDYSNKEIITEYDWYYYENNGELASGWRTIGGKTYYFDDYNYKMYYNKNSDIYPHWIDGDSYWFKESGEMIVGWYNCGGTWRYGDSDGRLYCSEWLELSGKYYYFDYTGRMLAGVQNVEIDGEYYDFNSDGSCKNPDGYITTMKPGWNKVFRDGGYKWYYYKDDLSMYFGWLNDGGKWYYMNEYTGEMTVGMATVGDDMYYFKEDGAMATGWVHIGEIYGKDYWRYADKNGALLYDRWLYDGGKWYYFTNEYGFGAMVYGINNYSIKGVLYNFDSSGACTNPDAKARKITGWFKKTTMFSSSWNYYGSDGELYTDKWLNDGGNWYYFVYDGTMIDYSGFYLDGNYYDFDSNGVCLNPYSPRSTYL